MTKNSEEIKIHIQRNAWNILRFTKTFNCSFTVILRSRLSGRAINSASIKLIKPHNLTIIFSYKENSAVVIMPVNNKILHYSERNTKFPVSYFFNNL